MEIVAQVFDWKITKTELDYEENKIRNQNPDTDQIEIRAVAITQLVDRYLLMQEAINRGFCINDDEFEEAFLELIDYFETSEASVLVNRSDRGEQLERILKSNLLIQKFIDSLDICNKTLTEEKLLQFYQERKDFFSKEEEVRASHILIKGKDKSNLDKITKIRNHISNAREFANFCTCDSECPSGDNCGDLGYFPRGRMIPEIEEVAFSMKVNEISQPFLSTYGYHILMVTDKRESQVIPYEEIKDCLKDSLKDIEEEIAITRILTEIRERSQDHVTIFDHAFK